MSKLYVSMLTTGRMRAIHPHVSQSGNASLEEDNPLYFVSWISPAIGSSLSARVQYCNMYSPLDAVIIPPVQYLPSGLVTTCWT